MRNICVIDDDHIHQFTLQHQIKKSKLFDEVFTFHNGQSAIVYLYENALRYEKLPDVILLDLNMPVMNGWQFVQAFKKIAGSLVKVPQIFLCSGTITIKDQSLAKQSKYVQGCIEKPVPNEILMDIVENASSRNHWAKSS